MATWLLALLLLAGGVEGDLGAALEQSEIARSGLGLIAGEAGGRVLFVHEPDRPLAPASNQKILTAAAVLQRLGEGFRFTTTLGASARGDLVVVGGGDPNLSGRFHDGDADRVLRLLAEDLAGHGVMGVDGDLVLDASRFDGETVHPDWPRDQLDRWYCAPVAALVLNDSCWDCTVLPGPSAGAPSRLVVAPSLLSPALSLDCVTVATGHHVVHIGRDAEHDLVVRGRILLSSAGVSGNVAVRDPVLFFGQALRAALAARGIAVDGTLRLGREPIVRPLLLTHSPLDRTLKVMLTQSQNLYAECCFKLLGEGSFASASEGARAALRDLGVPTGGLDVRDGSGLARTNRATARALYATLQALRDRPLFVDALPAGGEGTLERRYRELGPRVRAKTGTISGVSALSGYVTGRGGQRYVFAILANGSSVANARRLQDLVVRALANAP